MQHRFNSSYYDSYYCSNTCGVIQWIVDGTDVATHRVHDTVVGDVTVVPFPGDNTTIRYTSMISSRYSNNNSDICMDSVLIVTQSEAESPLQKRPQVKCNGGMEDPIPYTDEIYNDQVQVNNGTVILNLPVNKLDLVFPGNNFVTKIYLCITTGNSLSWLNDSEFIIAFNQFNFVGEKVVKFRHNGGLRVVILLKKHPLTSIFLSIDTELKSFPIACHSKDHYAQLPLATDQNSTNSGEEMTTSPPSDTDFMSGALGK